MLKEITLTANKTRKGASPKNKNLLFATLDSAFTNKCNKEVWGGFGTKAATSAVTSAMSFGIGSAGQAVSGVMQGASGFAQGAAQFGITAAGTYTTTVAVNYASAFDFSSWTFNDDRLQEAHRSWGSADTIAGALGAGVAAGLTTGINVRLNTAGITPNDFISSGISLGASLVGEAVKFGTHAVYNLGAGHGRDSFGKAFDDIGGLTFNLMNVATIAKMFGIENASDMNLGLFELQITKDGVSSRIGTGGIDVSGFLFDAASLGYEALRNHNTPPPVVVTEAAWRMAEEEREPIKQEDRKHSFIDEQGREQEVPSWLVEQLKNATLFGDEENPGYFMELIRGNPDRSEEWEQHFNLPHIAAEFPEQENSALGEKMKLNEIEQQISRIEDNMRLIYRTEGGFNSTESIELIRDLLNQRIELWGQYNETVIELGNLNIGDYMQNGQITSHFEALQSFLTGDYRANYHAGVDGVGGYAKTPFYTRPMRIDQGRSNAMTLEIIGTDLVMQIMHGDKNTYRKTGKDNIYRPGQEIMPFPTKNNSPESSTNPHFHFQMSNGTQFLNPLTLQPSSTVFRISHDGGRTWVPLNPNLAPWR